MAARDPEKTRRNKEINILTDKLQGLLPEVLRITGFKNELSLKAKIGSKHADFMDIMNEVIYSPEHFVSLWMNGMIKHLDSMQKYKRLNSNDYELQQMISSNKLVCNYTVLFLMRTYLRYYESLSKQRPKVEEAEMWIGQENANYGILITPRFRRGNWENDKSEIRHFKKEYWTIGHILETGMVVPFEDEIIEFQDTDDYLKFFKNVLVRASGSRHEKAIAKRYIDYVRSVDDPEKVPLLIPEFRYGGIERDHKYRLDFTIIDPYTLTKYGFELSPWSTHGELRGINGLTQKEINEIAKGNFEKEMRKHKDYFRKHSIYTLIYTDVDLDDPDAVFEDMKKYLNPKKAPNQLLIHTMDDFLNYRG